MTVADHTVLVTGANRGIGRALVDELPRRDVGRIYAGTRRPLMHPDARVIPVTLDVTDPAQIGAVAERVPALDLLINNAGLAEMAPLTDRAALERQLAVNLFGTLDVTTAFMPALIRGQGSIVNVLSMSALASLPVVPSYAISKAAAFSLTQATRAALAGRGVHVQAVLAGPVDTEMSAELEVPKATPESVARSIIDGVETGEDEIFPDPVAAEFADGWREGAVKALEREFSVFVPAEPVGS
jgi:NAD(P)-dependent dehydrogenase (short-subunit alcohol dehydrogenase family)